MHKLVLNTQAKRIVLDCSQIIYCRAENTYTEIFLKDGFSITISYLLGKIEKLLPKHCFCRCHRSYIVNITEVRVLDKKRKCLQLNCGAEIPVSNRNLSIVAKEIFKK